MTVQVAQRVEHLRDLALPESGPVFCDLDGCLIAGSHVFPGAAEMVRGLQDRLWIVTNNSYDTGISLSGRLRDLGLPLPAERLLLAGEQALELLAAERPGAAVRLYASGALRGALRDHGLRDARADGARGDVVLLARDAAFGLAEMAETLAALDDGVDLIVTNTDTAFPGRSGAPVPETGALLAGLLAVAPNLSYREIGKPAPYLLRAAASRAGPQAAHGVFVGDNPRTDGVAAAAAGIPFYLVDRRTQRREVA